MKINMELEGMPELYRSLKKLGKVPQKCVTASVRKAMGIPLIEARRNAPKKTGALRKGMKLLGERSRYKGKKVYRIGFNRDMNDVFQKKGSKGNIIAYYPISQEFGFKVRGRKIGGKFFIRNAFQGNVAKVEKSIMSNMKSKIDAEIAKGKLK